MILCESDNCEISINGIYWKCKISFQHDSSGVNKRSFKEE